VSRAGLATWQIRSQLLQEAGDVHKSSSTLPSLIDELRLEMRRSPRRSHLHELARHRIDAPDEIIDWAKRDRRWSFTLAEIMNEPIGMPRELAARLLVAIVDELEQEREAIGGDELGADELDGSAEIGRVAHAD
jgi:hypothetical protein